MTVAVGLCVCAAVVAIAGPPGRRISAAVPAAGRPAASVVRGSRDLSTLLLAVSAQLRAGAPPTQAWSRALGRPAVTVDALLALTTPAHRWRVRRSVAGPAAQRARAVVAAAHLSEGLGAPLAGVLDRIAEAVAADEEAEGERRAALAGPRATAQVLAWLPVLGVGLGMLLGADPVRVVLSGGLGTTAALLGVLLVVLGRWWTAALLRRAGGDTVGVPGRRRRVPR